MVDQLDNENLTQALAALDEWHIMENRKAISKKFKFKDFAEAWSFMSKVADLAEEMDHHPEWSNVYNKVDVILTTHDAGGISERDIKMARAIDAL